MRKFSLVAFIAFCLIAGGAIAAETMNAVHRTITVDGNAADWDMTASQPIHMTNPAAKYAANPMQVDIRYAWDETYLYCLIQEGGDSPIQSEAADGTAFAAGPWFFDCISPWINLLGDAGTPARVGFNPWLGFSSTGQTDLLCARVNSTIETSGATMNPASLVGSAVATSGTQAAHNRTIEARFQWSSIAGAVDADRQPAGGLVAAVQAGYKIGVDPLMIQENYTAQCFLNGQVGTPPSGTDEWSRYIVLTDAAAPPVVPSGGLYTNPGFDEGAVVTIDATQGADVVNGSSIPGWRAVAVAGGQGLFEVVAEATAPSAPQVFQVKRTSDVNFWFDRWDTPVDIDATKLHRHGAMVRQIGGVGAQLRLRASSYNDLVAHTGETYQPNGTESDIATVFKTDGSWVKVERLIKYPADALTALEMIYPETTNATFQVDNVVLEEYPLTSELCLNGRFESATDLVPSWYMALTPAARDNLAGSSITTDPANVAEGNNALHVVKDPITAGDALIRSYPVPWVAGHTAYVAYSIKNDPSIGADSRVEFLLRTHNGTAEGIVLGHLSGGAGDGGYLRREFEVPIAAMDVKTVYFDMRFRSAANEDNTPEALFVDFVSLGDLTAGGVPVEMSVFEME